MEWLLSIQFSERNGRSRIGHRGKAKARSLPLPMGSLLAIAGDESWDSEFLFKHAALTLGEWSMREVARFGLASPLTLAWCRVQLRTCGAVEIGQLLLALPDTGGMSCLRRIQRDHPDHFEAATHGPLLWSRHLDPVKARDANRLNHAGQINELHSWMKFVGLIGHCSSHLAIPFTAGPQLAHVQVRSMQFIHSNVVFQSFDSAVRWALRDRSKDALGSEEDLRLVKKMRRSSESS